MKLFVMLQKTEIIDVINDVIKTGHIFEMAFGHRKVHRSS